MVWVRSELQISKPRGIRFDELAEISFSRTEPILPCDDRQASVNPHLGGRCWASPTEYAEEFRPRLLSMLRDAELSTSTVVDGFDGRLTRQKVQALLYRLMKLGLVKGRRNPDQRLRGSGCAVHEYLWRLTVEGKKEARKCI